MYSYSHTRHSGQDGNNGHPLSMSNKKKREFDTQPKGLQGLMLESPRMYNTISYIRNPMWSLGVVLMHMDDHIQADLSEDTETTVSADPLFT